MKFHYYLRNDAGWAGLIFEDKNVFLNYDISYRGECLIQLLSGIIGISKSKIYIHSIERIHSDFVFENDKFEWHIYQGADSHAKFIFSKIDDSDLVNLKIIELDDYYNFKDEEGVGECVYNDNINFLDLLENILFSCSEILRKYGIIGYSKNFWNEFPVIYYLILKDFIRNEIKIDSFEELINDKEEHMFKTNIIKETEYLSSEN